MENQNENTVSIGNWIGSYFLLLIPVVNIILLFVWAFGGTAFRSKANWAAASLIFVVITVAIYFIVFVSILGVGAGLFY